MRIQARLVRRGTTYQWPRGVLERTGLIQAAEISLTFTPLSLSPSRHVLTIRVQYQADTMPRFLTLRGGSSACPPALTLKGDWNTPVTLNTTGTVGVWEATLPYASASNRSSNGGAVDSDGGVASSANASRCEFKVLFDDSVFQVGANQVVLPAAPTTTTIAVVYPWFNASAVGRVRVLPGQIYSPHFANNRSVAVYEPPLLVENHLARAQVLLLAADGNNLFDEIKCASCCPFGCWGAAATLDRLAAQGAVHPAILLVGVYNTAARMSEYTFTKDPKYGGGDADAYVPVL